MPTLRAARVAAFALALATVVAAPGSAAAQSQGVSRAPTPARLSVRDLARLRWIVGDWRGIGADGTPQAAFFERYRFADDSTLLVESFSDSTWRTITETARWELRRGRLGNRGPGAQWVAVRLDADAVEFAPVARARNSFRWARAGGDRVRPALWRATISWTDAAGTTQRRTYRMERVR